MSLSSYSRLLYPPIRGWDCPFQPSFSTCRSASAFSGSLSAPTFQNLPLLVPPRFSDAGSEETLGSRLSVVGCQYPTVEAIYFNIGLSGNAAVQSFWLIF